MIIFLAYHLSALLFSLPYKVRLVLINVQQAQPVQDGQQA